jgi:tetratricopeptide (TPR) repeat protein
VTRLCPELDEVRVLKDCGNLKFKEKNYVEAEKLYNDAILKLEDVREKVPAGQKSQMIALEVSTMLNLSNIKAYHQDYAGLLNLAKVIVTLNPESGKGYARYAEALYHMEKYSAALEKIKLAKKYCNFSESIPF